ncbi:unnamed protein product [Meloidogyne enterolobii]|uniref:Uncharacterized protein n=1 Tax=Meloidogyne enterolobii TaxID=390850 RepID=A0ACB0Y5M5_MELEN
MSSTFTMRIGFLEVSSQKFLKIHFPSHIFRSSRCCNWLCTLSICHSLRYFLLFISYLGTG